MMKNLFILFALMLTSLSASAQKKVMFDLSHGQFQDVFVDPSYYDYVIPGYEKIAKANGFELVMNRDEITRKSLKGIDALLIISPLAKSTQKNFTDTEKHDIAEYIRKGGSVILFVDEEQYRVNVVEYGVNAITEPFGIKVLDDVDVPGNCGAKTFEDEIFHGLREIPCSGVRSVRGGIPASVCMEGDGRYHRSSILRTAANCMLPERPWWLC